MAAELHDMQIVLVDDNRANLDLLEQILGTAGYENVVSVADATSLSERLRERPPDLVLLDLHMPAVDGFEVLRSLAPALGAPHYLPVMVISADTSVEVRRRALQLGARDFLLKPVDAIEVLLRTRNLLEGRYLGRTYPRALEQQRLEVLERLARFAQSRVAPDFCHPQRVAALAQRLAATFGPDAGSAEEIHWAALLHDVGKLAQGDPAGVEDGDLAALHTVIGADLLAASGSSAIDLAAAVARSHHERWDGGGYPDGLAGDSIPLAARVVAVADAYDHLAQRGGDTQALEEQSGGAFDPAVVAALRALERDWARAA